MAGLVRACEPSSDQCEPMTAPASTGSLSTRLLVQPGDISNQFTMPVELAIVGLSPRHEK